MLFRILMVATITLLASQIFQSCQKSTRTFFEPGVSKDLAQYRARHIYDVHYHLTFRIPEEQKRPVTGEAQIAFKPLKARHGIILDFQPGEESIDWVELNGEKVELNYMNGHIYLDANGVVPRQENVVTIKFTASDQALNRSEDFMYTLFVPDRASTAFPCFDQPDIKAPVSLSLEIPDTWSALANGKEIKQEKIAGGRKKVHFAAGKPLSTYVFAFTAGDFEIAEQTEHSKTIRIFHRETDQEKLDRNLPGIFQQHFQALNWMEDYTGISYPYKKFDMAILPGFQYSGMEHPGAIWYRDTRLLLDENPPITRRIRKASLIAHETAHMWFGNLVTMEWFDDVWLKEVFAGFIADKIVAQRFPEENHTLQFLLSHYPRSYSIDRTRGSHPIKQELDNMQKAGTLYGPIIYNKAPIVFEQLEKIMGPENFREAVKEYLRVFSHDNADWDDLAAIFDTHSSHDILEWSQAWIYGKGMPHISYVVEKDDSQEQMLCVRQDGGYEGDGFPAQLLSAWIVDDTTSLFPELGFSEKESCLDAPMDNPQPRLVLLNGGGLGYGFFELYPNDISFINEKISAVTDKVLRASAFINMHENFLRFNVDRDFYFEFLMRALGQEDDTSLQGYLLNNLEILCMNFLHYEKGARYSGIVEDLLWEKFQDVDGASKELFFHSWLKLARSEAHSNNMKAMYEGEVAVEDFSLSDQNRTLLAMEAAMRMPGNRVLLEKEQNRIDNPDRLRRFEFIVPALSAEKTVRDKFFESLTLPKNRRPEPWVLDALYFLHHPLHHQQGMDYILPSLEMLEEIQATGDIFFPQNWLGATLQNYRQPEVAEWVEQYLQENQGLSKNLKQKVYQSADNLFRSAQMH